MSDFIIQENLNQEGYDNDKDFYYLTENKDEINESNLQSSPREEFNDNIYQEDFDHSRLHTYSPTVTSPPIKISVAPPVTPLAAPKSKYNKVNKWLYIFLLILVVALVFYYLIDNKYIKLPSFESKGALSASPSSTSTLGSTFMSLH